MAGRKRAYVVGDFHLGCGDELEDFVQDDAFAQFVTSITDDQTTFFINGDFIDFAQIPPFDVPDKLHLLWTEQTSIGKFDKAVAAHPPCFDALKNFLGAGGKLCILTGNHDLDFAWNGVRDALRNTVMPPTDEQLRFSNGAERYHGVHIQHGFHFCAENSPADAAAFIHRWPDPEGPEYLERVWGTDFLLNFFNELERTYPFADNVKPLLHVLYHGIKKRWIGAREIVRLAQFLKRRGIPWKAVVAAALDGETSGEDLTPAEASSLVIGAFEDSEWRGVVAEALTDEVFTNELISTVRALPPADVAVLRQGPATDLGAVADTAEAAATLGVFREKRDRRAAAELLGPEVTHVVFGHTHEVVDGEQEDRSYFNPGTWLPRLNLKNDNVRAALRDGVTREVLGNKALYSIDRLAVQILPKMSHASHVELVPCD